jgi:UV DNA damage endonuclease
MRIGYPCINLSLSCRGSRTFRLRSYSEERMEETVRSNLACLKEILEYNLDHGLLFFRISSDLIPFASHPVCTYPWEDRFRETFRLLGSFVKEKEMRISMHPDQFVLVNSLRSQIFENSVKELEYHARVLDLMELDGSAKIQIHLGGAYGDKEGSLRRFIERYAQLPEEVKRRLVIENDDRLFDVADCIAIHEATGIPVLFDAFHFDCLNKGEPVRDAFSKTAATWSKDDGIPMADYSSQKREGRAGAHTVAIDLDDFGRFLLETEGIDFDIMLEIKNKERSALKALDLARTLVM